MLRVLLATGDVELDGAIASALAGKGAEVAGECRTREDAAGAAAGRGADVVVLSPRLPGRTGVVELVSSLSAAGLRVVLLAGARADAAAQSLAREATSLGVCDVVWDPVIVDQVVQRILTPGAPGEAGVVCGEGVTGFGGVAEEGGQKVPIWRRLFRQGKPAGHAEGGSRPVAESATGAPGGLAAGGALSRKAPAGLKAAGPGAEKALAGLASALLGGALPRPGETPAGTAIKEERGRTGGAPVAGPEGTGGAAGATVTGGKGGRSSMTFWKKFFPGREKGRGVGGDSRGGSAPERPLSPARAGQEHPGSSFNGPPAEAPGGLHARAEGDPGGGDAAPRAAGRAPAWEETPRRLEPAGGEEGGVPGGGFPRDAVSADATRELAVPRTPDGRNWADSRGSPAGALVLAGQDVAALLREAGIRAVVDPRDAAVCVCDPARAMLAPRGMPLLVVRSGSVSDLAAAMSRPDAVLVDRAELMEAVRRALAGEMPEDPEGGRADVPAPVPDEAARDPLTGCYTRRCLEALSLEPPCAVVFIDLDGFKEVNDTLGHDAGDSVLAAFGAVLRENLKGRDVPIRWGGDEFVLLLPGTAGAGAERVVDGLRRAWRKRAPDTGNLEVGFSVGVAEWRGGPLEEAVREADRLMYAEKRARKEREAARTGALEGRRAPRREGRPSVYVLPGRKVEGGAAVPEHGAVYVACPGEPPEAGRMAAALTKQVPGSALVCASGTSTAALALGMRPEDLVLSDWRVPGSDVPVGFGGVVVWPVDPGKFLGARDVPPHALVSQIRHRFPLVVVDCGGDLSLCAGAPRDAAVVVAKTGGEASDWVVERWLRDYGGNALVVRAGEELVLERVGGGFILRAGETAARDRHLRKP